MALLGLKVEGGPYRNLQRAAKPAREEEKRKLKLRLSRTPARKDQQGFGMLLIAD